jgi:hypothetical protein
MLTCRVVTHASPPTERICLERLLHLMREAISMQSVSTDGADLP